MAKIVNDTQQAFEELCRLGGGSNGGPVAGKVMELLRSSGQRVNEWAYRTMEQQMSAVPDANPWHICFAMGLSWGHLAKVDTEFTKYACAFLTEWNEADLLAASDFYMERGPAPIRESLKGAYQLFESVTLPDDLPTTLPQLNAAQHRWLGLVINRNTRPRYIGSWNSTAMFMAALFANPALARQQKTHEPLLPPGGPVYAGLKKLYLANVISKAPDGNQLDDEAFEPGSLYVNNALMTDIVRYLDDWCLLDVHTGIYMLGTQHRESASW